MKIELENRSIDFCSRKCGGGSVGPKVRGWKCQKLRIGEYIFIFLHSKVRRQKCGGEKCRRKNWRIDLLISAVQSAKVEVQGKKCEGGSAED